MDEGTTPEIGLRDILLEATRVAEPVGVLLSNGADSNSLLASLIRNEIKPTVLSFRLAGRVSTDWSAARRTARALSLRFLDVELPIDVDSIAQDVRHAVKSLGLRKKADIECAIPVRYALDVAKANDLTTVFSGAAADGHFGLSRKAVIRAHTGDGMDDPKWLDDFRDAYFARVDPAQTRTMSAYGKRIGVRLLSPYVDKRIVEVFRGSSWRSLNMPRQKMPTRRAFPEIETWKVGRTHVNLQLGDSRIAENFTRLIDSPYNKRGSRSVVGIYNDFARNL